MPSRPASAPTAAEPTLVIGELAARTGTTPEAIRYYERVGVLPAPARAGGGRYRRYRAADVERLGFVRRARELGFSLDEVRDLLGLADQPERPCGEVDRLAQAHLAAVNAKLAQLAALRDELERVIGACRGGHAVADCRILGALGDVGGGAAPERAPAARPFAT
jgi:DNA-binding transcriptional MerR regulator